METNIFETQFAPAQRAAPYKVMKHWQFFNGLPYIRHMLDAVPDMMLVLNDQRQIVFCNRLVLNTIGTENELSVIGLRPGEAMGCAHSSESPGGCGTALFCQTCGAVSAILSAINGREDVQECRIARNNRGAVEFMDVVVRATPLETETGRFTVFSIQDISHKRRRRMLERTFFHDILNSVGALTGYVQLYRSAEEDDRKHYMEAISEVCEHVVDEVLAQKELLTAESNELSVAPNTVYPVDFLHQVVRVFACQETAQDRSIVIDPVSESTQIETDATILGRIIGNLIKNALEASEPGETLTVGCENTSDGVRFSVHNQAHMPRNVQLQVFMQSFSTKGFNEGLGHTASSC